MYLVCLVYFNANMIFCLAQSRSIWPDPKVCTVQKLSGGVLMESLCSTEVLVSLFPLITKETLFILLSFYAPYSDILASAETLAPQHKDWVTLSAGSGYRLFFSARACTALTGTKHPHTKTHILTTASSSASPNALLYQGCQMLPAWPYHPQPPPPPPTLPHLFSSQPSEPLPVSPPFDIYISTEF